MTGDRMATLLRVRDLVERRRLAEQADASRQVADAGAAHEEAVACRGVVGPPAGATLGPAALTALRCGAIAVEDAVVRAQTAQETARHALERAERRTVAAAIERRSAERLRDRRAAAQAAEDERIGSRRDDDVALQVWRRRA